MPIVRTYACPACNLMMEVTLNSDQWDADPPPCPECRKRDMRQEYRPVAISGSPQVRARDIAEDIAAKDYHVADMQRDKYAQRPTVRYQDQTPSRDSSTWGVAQGALEAAIVGGRETRVKYGSGLDVLQANLKSGVEPDLIEGSKRRMIKVW